MSRKKSPRGKGASSAAASSPSSALPAAQQPPPPAEERGAKARGAAAGRGGAEAGAANGVAAAALPGRPSLSSSGEFYDVAFKVSAPSGSPPRPGCSLLPGAGGGERGGRPLLVAGGVSGWVGGIQTVWKPACLAGGSGSGLAEGSAAKLIEEGGKDTLHMLGGFGSQVPEIRFTPLAGDPGEPLPVLRRQNWS